MSEKGIKEMKAEFMWHKHLAALERKDFEKAEEYFNNLNKLYEGNDN